ncbi:MAG TPA: hypothetical protein VN081_05030 [Dongiaceae bacterium]|nr:hypothetical protein [Dongiaceae bacterium]
MTDVYAQNLVNQIISVRNNPMAVQRMIYQAMDDVSNGTLDVVDPSNPFAFLIEMGACLGSASMVNDRTLAYDQYPTLAQTQESLYKWMSDKDFANRFAQPATADFLFMFGIDELKELAVDTGNNGVKQLTIPRDTTVSVAGYDFTMQYPINILVMPTGDLQITYDSSLPSPLQSLPSNIVPYKILTISGIDFLALNVNDVLQMSVTSQVGQINMATGFSSSYSFADQYYFTRVYSSNADGSWTEIATTYSAQVFDPQTPTVLLTVNADNTVTVTVPQIYLTNGMLVSELRIDVYSTKGAIVLQLENYTTNQYSATWQDFDTPGSIYSAPLNNFGALGINSVSMINDGQNVMALETLRANVINNTMGDITLPITNVQAGATAGKLGYGFVTDVDVITNRQFLATREIDPPADGSLVTGAGVSMNTFSTTMSSLVGLQSVTDNGSRMTILPSTLYQNTNGVITIAMPAQIQDIQAMDPDSLAMTVNNGDFLYSPFHYVLDASDDVFAVRPYYLDAPAVVLKTYVAENATTDLTVATATYKIVRTSNGYQLQVMTQSSANFQQLPDAQVFAQLAYIPVGETEYAYLNGTLQPTKVNGERVFTFNLTTNYDFDASDNIVLTSFSMFLEGARNHSANLNQQFQLIYGVSGYNATGQQSSVIDTILGTQLLPTDSVGVTQELYELELGIALDGLWHATRSVASQEVYATHTANVPLLYPHDVLLTDPVTGVPEFTIVNGVPRFTVLHAGGSPVLDNYGNPVYQNLIGDPILDSEQQPVTVLARDMSRMIDMLMIDGIYWWATNSTAVSYKNSIPQTIAGWLTSDIAELQSLALEETYVYFYPKSSVGQVSVQTQSGSKVTIDAEQTFNVTYYLSPTAYNNSSFTTALTSSTKSIIAQQLTGGTVSIENIQTALRENVNTQDVISLGVTGLGGTLNLDVVQMVDDSQRLTVGKILVALPDGTYTVQDAINVSYVPFGS